MNKGKPRRAGASKGATKRSTKRATNELTNRVTTGATNKSTDRATDGATIGITSESTNEAINGATEESTNEATAGTPMGIVVAVGGQKGGPGKSNAAICIATELQARGLRVALVDVDPQGTATTWADVAREVGAPVPTIRRMGVGMGDESELPALALAHDVTVIDCPAHLDRIQREAIILANTVIVVCGPNAPDVWSLGATLDVLAEARQLRPDLDVVMLLSRRRPSTVLGRQSRSVLESAGLELLDADLADRVTYPQAIGAGRGPTTFAPTSQAAREVRRLVTELLRRWK